MSVLLIDVTAHVLSLSTEKMGIRFLFCLQLAIDEK